MSGSDPVSRPVSPPRVNVLGVGISALNLDLALQEVARALEQKNKGYICVTGVHGVMEAQKDFGLRSILNRSFLNTPDGMPMVWAGKWNGFGQMDRVYGPDLMFLVCEFTRNKQYTHFLYGGGEGVAETLYRSIYEQRLQTDDQAIGMLQKIARRVDALTEDDPGLPDRWRFLMDFLGEFRRGDRPVPIELRMVPGALEFLVPADTEHPPVP